MLEITQVTKLFNPGTTDEKTALVGVNLTMNPGDFVTVIGSNGAGKSTLMNIISGVMKPDMGDVLINDRSIKNLPEHKRVTGSVVSFRTRWLERHRICLLKRIWQWRTNAARDADLALV